MTRAYSVLAGVALVASVGCHEAMERTQGYEDEKITAAVEAALRANVPGSIQVSTRDGIVTLSGSVPDAATREQVGKIASNTTGVTGVNNGVRATIAADAPVGARSALPPPAPVMK